MRTASVTAALARSVSCGLVLCRRRSGVLLMTPNWDTRGGFLGVNQQDYFSR